MRGRDLIYLKDIFIIGITTFGGVQTHLPVMHRVLVDKRRYFTEGELLEFSALCQMLPGPTSTQIILALSQKKGGIILALLSLLLWILPACIVMALVAIAFSVFEMKEMPTHFLRFVAPMAIGIIAHAGYRMAVQVIHSIHGLVLMLIAMGLALITTSPWTFPSVLLGAAIYTNFTNKEKTIQQNEPGQTPWQLAWVSLSLFVFLFMVVGVLAIVLRDKPVILFENFFRFGTITFGGSHVLVPLMFEQFVNHRQYLTTGEFLSGYAISQSLPGPSFAFATFAGGLALDNMGMPWLFSGCIIGTVGIFLPGVLILFFVYPFWQYLKNYFFIRRSLEGIQAASVGLILSASVLMYSHLTFSWSNAAVIVSTFCLLQFSRIHIPVLVVLALVAGLAYSWWF